MDEWFCEALEDWIVAGPRENTNSRDIRIWRSADEPGHITMYSMGYRSKCSDEDCMDDDDEEFAHTLAPMTHYWWIADFTEKASTCLGGSPRIGDIDLSEEDTPPRQSVAKRANAMITISWKRGDCGYQGCTAFEVTYD